MKSKQSKKYFAGYTLVELLVVVSIISLISSIVLVALTASKARAQDAARIGDVSSIKTAILSYKNDHNGSAPTISGVANSYGYTDDTSDTFQTTLQPLVSKGYLTSLPPPNLGLFYINSGPDLAHSDDQVIIGTRTVVQPLTTTGAPGTCRPYSEVGYVCPVNFSRGTDNAHPSIYIDSDYAWETYTRGLNAGDIATPFLGDPAFSLYLEIGVPASNTPNYRRLELDCSAYTGSQTAINNDVDGHGNNFGYAVTLISYCQSHTVPAQCAVPNEPQPQVCNSAAPNSDYCLCI